MAAAMTYWVRDNPITNAQNDVNDVKTTFSSWDNCMKKDYCKYPAIILIVVGSLIALSIIFCLVRCLCCGLECCCGCFSCMNACCSCCQPRRRRWGNDDDYNRGGPPGGGGWNNSGPYGGYQAPPAQPVYVNVQAPAAQRYEPSRQYAAFDTPSKRGLENSSYGAHDDSLPAMPSWNDAKTSRIETEEEAVEMDHLYNTQAQRAPMLPGQGSSAGVNRGMAPTPSAQTPGQGLYRDEPSHQYETGDIGEAYGHHDTAYAGAAGVAAGAAAAGGAAHYHDGYDNGYDNGYGHQQSGTTGGYGSPQQQYPSHQQTVSPPPHSNFTSPPPSYQHTGPVSPVSTPGLAGLPSSLTPGSSAVGGGFQPPQQSAYQSYGQQTGVTGGAQQYGAYQQHGHPPQGSWHDV